jgi:pimeloyl-ACP methyl ester carboxylesterase
VAVAAALTVAVVLMLGFAWQAVAARRDRRKFKPPGCIVDGLHVFCTGTGRPVVLEAGIAASSISWALVQQPLSRYARVCAYDRRGLGWSARAAAHRSVDEYLRDLRTAVRHAGTPAILVGHSFGGLLVRLYAYRYPADVAGLVLVDPALTAEWASPTAARLAMLRRGVVLSRRGGSLARTGFVRLALTLLKVGARPTARLFARASGSGASVVTERIVGQVRKLPPELWPAIQSHWCRPECFTAMAEHLESLPDVAAAAARLPRPPAPTVVISGAHLRSDEIAEHRALGEHVVAEGSGHWVHLDRPDLIVDAVRRMLES